MRKVLLIWWYNRADLFIPFEKLKNDFDFSLIFYKYEKQQKSVLPLPTYFWSDFKGPKEIVETLRPRV